MMAFNGILNAAQDWLLVQATVNYSMFTSCLSLNTVCPCVTHRVTGCGEEQVCECEGKIRGSHLFLVSEESGHSALICQAAPHLLMKSVKNPF